MLCTKLTIELSSPELNSLVSALHFLPCFMHSGVPQDLDAFLLSLGRKRFKGAYFSCSLERLNPSNKTEFTRMTHGLALPFGHKGLHAKILSETNS